VNPFLPPPNMSFFKSSRSSSNTYIPPVSQYDESDRQPYNRTKGAGKLYSATSPRSSANTYPNIPTASQDDEFDRQPYNRNKGAGDVYSRGTAELEKDRSELFSGYNPAKTGSGRFFDGPSDDLEGNDEDVENIKQQTRFVKQESVNSTRNALRLAREAEEAGRNTLNRLGDQSGKFFFSLYGSPSDFVMQKS
jgi:hypothetical protein